MRYFACLGRRTRLVSASIFPTARGQALAYGPQGVKDPVDVLIVDPHSIYRCGLATCLCGLDEIGTIAEAESIADARDHPSLPEIDLVIVDHELPGTEGFVREVRNITAARVLVYTSRSDEDGLLGVIQAGAVGLMSKQSLTPDALAAGVRAAMTGAGVVAPELLGSLLAGLSRVARDVLEPRGLTLSRLTPREQQVLSMIADGHPTREVATELCYSERTVKNVLHDIVIKLNVRTRSQAVAFAVREGLI
jgi:DNA-binding NarL/FixJ family response regulator